MRPQDKPPSSENFKSPKTRKQPPKKQHHRPPVQRLKQHLLNAVNRDPPTYSESSSSIQLRSENPVTRLSTSFQYPPVSGKLRCANERMNLINSQNDGNSGLSSVEFNLSTSTTNTEINDQNQNVRNISSYSHLQSPNLLPIRAQSHMSENQPQLQIPDYGRYFSPCSETDKQRQLPLPGFRYCLPSIYSLPERLIQRRHVSEFGQDIHSHGQPSEVYHSSDTQKELPFPGHSHQHPSHLAPDRYKENSLSDYSSLYASVHPLPEVQKELAASVATNNTHHSSELSTSRQLPIADYNHQHPFSCPQPESRKELSASNTVQHYPNHQNFPLVGGCSHQYPSSHLTTDTQKELPVTDYRYHYQTIHRPSEIQDMSITDENHKYPSSYPLQKKRKRFSRPYYTHNPSIHPQEVQKEGCMFGNQYQHHQSSHLITDRQEELHSLPYSSFDKQHLLPVFDSTHHCSSPLSERQQQLPVVEYSRNHSSTPPPPYSEVYSSRQHHIKQKEDQSTALDLRSYTSVLPPPYSSSNNIERLSHFVEREHRPAAHSDNLNFCNNADPFLVQFRRRLHRISDGEKLLAMLDYMSSNPHSSSHSNLPDTRDYLSPERVNPLPSAPSDSSSVQSDYTTQQKELLKRNKNSVSNFSQNISSSKCFNSEPVNNSRITTSENSTDNRINKKINLYGHYLNTNPQNNLNATLPLSSISVNGGSGYSDNHCINFNRNRMNIHSLQNSSIPELCSNEASSDDVDSDVNDQSVSTNETITLSSITSSASNTHQPLCTETSVRSNSAHSCGNYLQPMSSTNRDTHNSIGLTDSYLSRSVNVKNISSSVSFSTSNKFQPLYTTATDSSRIVTSSSGTCPQQTVYTSSTNTSSTVLTSNDSSTNVTLSNVCNENNSPVTDLVKNNTSKKKKTKQRSTPPPENYLFSDNRYQIFTDDEIIEFNKNIDIFSSFNPFFEGFLRKNTKSSVTNQRLVSQSRACENNGNNFRRFLNVSKTEIKSECIKEEPRTINNSKHDCCKEESTSVNDLDTVKTEHENVLQHSEKEPDRETVNCSTSKTSRREIVHRTSNLIPESLNRNAENESTLNSSNPSNELPLVIQTQGIDQLPGRRSSSSTLTDPGINSGFLTTNENSEENNGTLSIEFDELFQLANCFDDSSPDDELSDDDSLQMLEDINEVNGCKTVDSSSVNKESRNRDGDSNTQTYNVWEPECRLEEFNEVCPNSNA